MTVQCIYCGLLFDVDSTNYIVLTDSFDWVGHAHPECQKIAEQLAIEGLFNTIRVTHPYVA